VVGCVFDIQRFCIHDGPGIRTTVFLKGCPLRCVWCHNPEGIAPQPELSFMPDRCIGCGACARACRHGAHEFADGLHIPRRERCVVCGACAQECAPQALEVVGREQTVEEVLREVLSDRPFYETSGGGMTLSGGEPTLQIDFAVALLAQARAAGVHTCVETCCHCSWERLEQMLPLVDLFLIDVKETDSARHRAWTGAPNEPILENIRRLDAAGAPMLLRCPLVPGLNDREDHWRAIARLARGLKHVRGVEVMPYHALGESKRARFGHPTEGRLQPASPSPQTLEHWREYLRKAKTE
jgi:pyruvate formate lyase activating enzyme